jgi:hypothetical protein
MSQPKYGKDVGSANVFRFSLAGLIGFCLCLVAGTSFVMRKAVGSRPGSAPGPAFNIPEPDEQDKYTFTRQGPWGELLTQEISLQRPVEYLSQELSKVQPPVWTFYGLSVPRVQSLFIASGLPPQQAEQALAPDRVSTQGTNTVFKPSDEFVFALNSETRDRLYSALRGLGVNVYLDWPYFYPRDTVESVFADTRPHPDDLALFKQLVYGGKDAWRFSDFETLMVRIPTPERRLAMTASLARQPAVLTRLCIRPNTDLDQVAAYWGHAPNVRFIEIRPMLEALKRLPNGGTISLAFLLPPFPRERLYTYPLPPAPGEPVPDCHWTTLNFWNAKPDNRLLDAAECGRRLDDDFYVIAQPGMFGDVLVFLDRERQRRHSAVYLADDLVFTKNGQSYVRPWMIMRISDLQALYRDFTIVYLRRKTN